MELRKCTVCKEEKSLSNFRKDNSRKDGIHKTCNECNNKKMFHFELSFTKY